MALGPVRSPHSGHPIILFGRWGGQPHSLLGLPPGCLTWKGAGGPAWAWIGIWNHTWAAAVCPASLHCPWRQRIDCQPCVVMEAGEAGSGGALHNLCSLHPPVGLLGTFAGLSAHTSAPWPSPSCACNKGDFPEWPLVCRAVLAHLQWNSAARSSHPSSCSLKG